MVHLSRNVAVGPGTDISLAGRRPRSLLIQGSRLLFCRSDRASVADYTGSYQVSPLRRHAQLAGKINQVAQRDQPGAMRTGDHCRRVAKGGQVTDPKQGGEFFGGQVVRF
jgi:hypothetical protein